MTAEFVPGEASPTAAAVSDFTVDREPATTTFRPKNLMQRLAC
jgi:hypothetical protein